MVAIGEFSLMIAAVAIGSSAIRGSINLYPTIVLVTTITALVVPYSVKYSERVTKTLEIRTPRSVLVLASYLNLVMRNMRRRSQTSHKLSNEMRGSISRLFVYIIVMVSVVALAVSTAPNISDFAYLTGGNEELLLFILITASLVVVESSLYGIWSRTIRLIEISTSEAMLTTKSAENIGYQDTAKALKWVFLAFYIIVGFIVVSPLVRSMVQQGFVFALLVIAIIAMAIVALWGSVKTIDKKLSEIFERTGPASYGESSADLAEIEEIIATMERGKA
jgi:glucan phosphoethanolaminetransferase (alkaline phosphatase superfamily)